MKKFTSKGILLLYTLLFPLLYFAQSSDSMNWVQMMQDPNANFYDVQNAFNAYWNGRAYQKGKGYKQFKRWAAYMEPRVYPSGDMKLPSKSYEMFKEWELEHPEEALTNKAPGSVWTSLGPVGAPNYGGAGRLNFLRFDPTNTNTLYVGAPDGGLWKSTNGGTSWTTNTDQLTVIGCSDIAIDPTNTQIMFLATGDGEAGDSYSTGVLKSTDGGATWNTTGLNWTVSQGRQISKLLMNPSNSAILIAATSNGIYRTTDSGATWTQVQNSASFKDMEFKPGDPNTMYAVGSSLYKSTNNGATWTQITSGLPTTGVERMSLAVTAANSAYVYILAGRSSDQGLLGVYRSTDSGATFSTVKGPTSPNLLGWNSSGGDSGGQAFYDLTIAASPTNANTVIVGGVNLWKSTDGGTSWAIIGQWSGSGAPYVHADQHDIVFLPGSSTTFFCANDGGLYKTTNTGSTWVDLSNNLEIAQQYRLGLSATTEGTLVAGHQDNGTTKLSGGSWSEIYGGDGMDCFIDRTNNSIIYSSYANGDYSRSTNGGSNWSSINSGLPSGDWVSAWHQDPISATTVYAGGRAALYKTTNSGSSWTALGTPSGSGNVIEFAIAPSNNSIIYAVKYNAVSKSTNSGSSWTNITGSLPTSSYLTNICVHNTDPNIIWVTYSGYSATTKVYKSTNGGSTWTNISTGLPNVPCNTIVFQNGGANDPVYVGTDIGVYYKDNSAGTWVSYFDGLPRVSVRDLEIFYPTGKIRAATFGRGTWQNDLMSPGASIPTAEFSGPQTGCPGSSITFTDESAFSPTSWTWAITPGTAGVDWSYTGGTSSTSQNIQVQFNVAGSYTVVLTATNANGSDSNTKSNYVTISGGTSQSLPISEGFTATTFPATNWTIKNSNASTTWVRSSTVGYAPTAGNCMVFQNYSVDDSGDNDEVRLPKASFTGLSSAQLTFDVAYAPYDASYFDGLEVAVSTDCGGTYTTVYSKSNTTLATAPAIASEFIPTSTQWRTETVNLASYIGQAGVIVAFRNLPGYGNNIYVDNINLTGIATAGAPVAAFSTASNTVCAGNTITYTNTSTNSPTSYAWTFAGGTPSTSTAANPTVTYNTAGTYTVTLTATNAQGSNTSTQTNLITVNPTPTTPTISAGGSTTICQGGSVTLTSSSATGNTWSTGATTQSITVSTAGTYTVTVSNGTCSKTSAGTSVTVNPLPSTPTISASGATTFCAGGSVTLTSSSATGNTWSTGATTQSITVSTNGTYTVTYSNGSCSATSTTTNVSVISTPTTPTISTSGATTFCQGNSVVLTSSASTGNTWSTGATTQSITVTNGGNYSVTAGASGCSATSTITNITVNPLPTTPTVNAGGPTTFCQGGNVVLTSSASSGNTWSNGSTSQSITVTSPGTYTVNTNNGSCTSLNSSATNVIVNSLPTVALSNLSTMCVDWAASSLTGGTPLGGTYSGNGVTSNVFTPSIAGVGTTTITYSYTDNNSCTNTATSSLIVESCATIDEVSNSLISIYPNPTNGEINIITKDKMINAIQLLDETGRLVKVFETSQAGIYSVDELSDGIYTLLIQTEDTLNTFRISVIR